MTRTVNPWLVGGVGLIIGIILAWFVASQGGDFLKTSVIGPSADCEEEYTTCSEDAEEVYQDCIDEGGFTPADCETAYSILIAFCESNKIQCEYGSQFSPPPTITPTSTAAPIFRPKPYPLPS